ncbi:MAG: flagellar hook-associated protein FlgK, partial [Chloroflexi bacterium]|nr:flagellar hook-associated protein FlgK [Chloroflexota bacterium]
MLPTFFGLNTVTRALLAQQEAVDVVNQNIANASTPGYSEQVPILDATDPYTAPAFDRPAMTGLQIGTGVQVSRVDRLQDELLNAQIRNGTQSVGQLTTMDDYYGQIQSIYNDPSNLAINSASTAFFNAVHDVSNSPEDQSARQALEQSGEALAGAISTRYNDLTQLQLDLNTQVGNTVNTINSTITQIAQLNHQIALVNGVGDNANDLMDQRDVLVDTLSKLVDTRDVKNSDGTDTIQLNGRFLVNKDTAYTLTTLTDASSTAKVKPLEVFWAEDVNKFNAVHPGYDPISGKNLTTGVALTNPPASPPLSVTKADVTTGTLAGLLQMRDDVIQNTLLPQLNELADALTNTQVLSKTTGLTANSKVSATGAAVDQFTITVIPGAAVGSVAAGQPTTFTVKAGPGSTVQNILDQINSSSVSPFIHASLNAAGQLQIDTTLSGSLVKVDQASASASTDFGFSSSVADGFNLVHTQGYGLNTPAQITGGVSGLTLQTLINIGGVNDTFKIAAPDGSTLNIVVPSPNSPATTNTVQDLLTAINSAGLSHGVQASLDDSGHLIIYAAPTVMGANGQVVGTPAQLVSTNTAPLSGTTTFTGGASAGSFTITGPTGQATFTTTANMTVQQLIQQINGSNLGVSASLTSIGQFQITSLQPGSGQTVTLSAVAGADATTLLGISNGTATG